jgi:membrane-associated phospholipid phosphatase
MTLYDVISNCAAIDLCGTCCGQIPCAADACQHALNKEYRIDMTRSRFASLITFLRARFSSQGHLGLHLTIGTCVLIGMTWLFGSIAEDVMTSEPIVVTDAQVAQWFHTHATPALTEFMLALTNMHGTLGILTLSVLLGFFLFRKKDWYWLVTLVICVPNGLLLNVLLKQIFQRARPGFDNPLLTLSTYSFPSGHTAGATLFYGVLSAYLIYRNPRWHWRMLIAACAVVMVGMVGLSRMYLGVHYLSDVLAAIAWSSAWLALCLTAVTTWRRRAVGQSLAN